MLGAPHQQKAMLIRIETATVDGQRTAGARSLSHIEGAFLRPIPLSAPQWSITL